MAEDAEKSENPGGHDDQIGPPTRWQRRGQPSSAPGQSAFPGEQTPAQSTLQNDIYELRGKIAHLESRLRKASPVPRIFLAKITGSASGKVAWKEQYGTDAGLVDYADGLNCDDDTDSTAATTATGGSLTLMVAYENVDKAIYISVPLSTFFPVLVKPNGGSDGTDTTYATWAYDLFNLFDTSFLTKLNASGPLQPLRSSARVAMEEVAPALLGTVGVAFYDASGNIQLWDCQELSPQFNCMTG